MLGGSHPAREVKPKKAKKTSNSSRTMGSRPRKAAPSSSTTAKSSAPPRRAKISPGVDVKRGGATKKRKVPSDPSASLPEKHQPIIPLDNIRHNNGLNPLALPKGFKGRKVVYAGHKVASTDTVLYAGETFVINNAVWFIDYTGVTKVRFQIFHPKMQFGMSILPEDLKIGKKNLISLAKAMLKHAGR